MSSEQKPNKDYIGAPVFFVYAGTCYYLSNISEGSVRLFFQIMAPTLLLIGTISAIKSAKK